MSVWAGSFYQEITLNKLWRITRSPRNVVAYVPNYTYHRIKSHVIRSSSLWICPERKTMEPRIRSRIIFTKAITSVFLSHSMNLSDDISMIPNNHRDDQPIDVSSSIHQIIEPNFETENDYIDSVDYEEEDEEETAADERSVRALNDASATIDPTRTLYHNLKASLDKALTNLQKKKHSLITELEKAKNLESTMKRANLILSNLYRISPGMTQVEVEDWDEHGDNHMITLVLDYKNYESAQEEAEALFAAARKMKRGSRVVEELLSDLDPAAMILQDVHQQLIEMEHTESYDINILQSFQIKLDRTSLKTGFKMVSDPSNEGIQRHRIKPLSKNETTRYQPTFRKFTSPNGCDILVGRSRRENESLCFQVARDDDIWMHARGTPGAHVLIQVRRGKPIPTEECLQYAANLAVFYSDARSERKAEVTTAEPKHILKPRGAPLGAVKLRKEGKTLIGRPQDVPQECKEAREESGVGWDEMGSKKAENRKWTKAKTEEVISKIRADKRAKKNRQSREEGTTT